MLKKLKDLLIGMIIGTLLVYAIPTIANSIKTYIAEEATFPILVDGQEVKLDMPVVTIEGRTYLPLRALGDILQVDVDWNSNLNRVEINKEKPTKNSKVGANMDNSNKINVIDEYNIEVDGVRYIKEGFIGATIISKGSGAEPEVRQMRMEIIMKCYGYCMVIIRKMEFV